MSRALPLVLLPNGYTLNRMGIHIQIPENSDFLQSCFRNGDIGLVYGCLLVKSPRPLVFFTERLSGCVLHVCDSKTPQNSPRKVCLTTEAVSGAPKSLIAESGRPGIAGDAIGAENLQNRREVTTQVLNELRIEGDVDAADGTSVHVTAWLFSVSVPSISGDLGVFKLTASIDALGYERQKSISLTAKDAQNSILNDTSLPEQSLLLSMAVFEAAMSPPLLLSLRTTNMGNSGTHGGCVFATLRVLAPRASSVAKENLHLNILSLTASAKGGKVVPMGNTTFPLRCAFDDVVHLTYRLDFPEFLAEPGAELFNPGNSLSFKFIVQYQKFDHPITPELPVRWSPSLDCGNPKTQLNPTPQNRKAVTTSTITNQSRSPNGFSGKIGPSGINSPNGTVSSPSLSITKSAGVLKHKPYRSAALLPGTALTVTLNLAIPTTSILSGLRLSFTGKLSISLGEVAYWKLQVINTGTRDMNLHMSARKSRKNTQVYALPNNSSVGALSIASNKSTKKEGKAVKFEDRYVTYSPIQLYNQYNSLKPVREGVVILTNDLRLGKLEAEEVFETEFQLVGFVKGVHTLEGLRIYDVHSGEGIEVGRLLEVFVI